MHARFQLAELLEDAGMSQRQLAADSGVSPTTINRMCRNLTRQVSLATLEELAKPLGCKPQDIITDAPPGRRRKSA